MLRLEEGWNEDSDEDRMRIVGVEGLSDDF